MAKAAPKSINVNECYKDLRRWRSVDGDLTYFYDAIFYCGSGKNPTRKVRTSSRLRSEESKSFVNIENMEDDCTPGNPSVIVLNDIEFCVYYNLQNNLTYSMTAPDGNETFLTRKEIKLNIERAYREQNKKSDIDPRMFDPEYNARKKQVREESIWMIKYVIEKLLGWKPAQAAKRMNLTTWHRFCLDKYALKILEENPSKEHVQPKYVLSLVYDEITYDEKDHLTFINSSSSRRQKGEIGVLTFASSMPRHELMEFKVFVTENLSFVDERDLYYLFSFKSMITNKMEETGMAQYAKECFYPVELLHAYLCYYERKSIKGEGRTLLHANNFLYLSSYIRNVVDYRDKVSKSTELLEKYKGSILPVLN